MGNPISMLDLAIVNDLLPLAAEWAEAESSACLAKGRELSSNEKELAVRAGVAVPDRIRVLELDNFPFPNEPLLRKAAISLGLLGPNIEGLTFGYAVFLRRGSATDGLLSHEFRHVYQFEQLGSLEAFLTEYLSQIAVHGYRDAPFEIDARNSESPFKLL